MNKKFNTVQEMSLFERVINGSYTRPLNEKVSKIGSISTAFTEVPDRLFKENFEPSAIRAVTRKDVTGKHFIDWFFALENWVDESPQEFPFAEITHSNGRNVYGYFNGDDLDGLIRVDEDDDEHELSFFCVNPAFQHRGLGSICLSLF